MEHIATAISGGTAAKIAGERFQLAKYFPAGIDQPVGLHWFVTALKQWQINTDLSEINTECVDNK